MSTNSTIAIEREDGTVAQIYAHWDGYLDCNGKILQTHYQDPNKVSQLIALGNVSSLAAEVGEPHEFEERFTRDDPRAQWTKFYGRDRGDEDVEAQVFKNFDDYRQSGDNQEYNYILRRDGKWYVQSYHFGQGKFYLLTEAFEIAAMEEE